MPLHHTLEALGHEGITDVICLMGFYTRVSMTLGLCGRPCRGRGHGPLSWAFRASARTNPRRGPNAEIAALPQGSGRRDRDGRGRCISYDRKDRERQRSERQDLALKDVRFIRSFSPAPRQAFDRRCTGEHNQDWTASA